MECFQHPRSVPPAPFPWPLLRGVTTILTYLVSTYPGCNQPTHKPNHSVYSFSVWLYTIGSQTLYHIENLPLGTLILGSHHVPALEQDVCSILIANNRWAFTFQFCWWGNISIMWLRWAGVISHGWKLAYMYYGFKCLDPKRHTFPKRPLCFLFITPG